VWGFCINNREICVNDYSYPKIPFDNHEIIIKFKRKSNGPL